MDDEQLIAALAAGDDGALREFFARHAPWLAARLRRTLPAATVEDVLQETFIAVWRGARVYRAEGAPGAWLWGIARRQAATWARKHGRPDLALPDEMATVPARAIAASPDPAATVAERIDLERAFAALGPPDAPQRERRVQPDLILRRLVSAMRV